MKVRRTRPYCIARFTVCCVLLVVFISTPGCRRGDRSSDAAGFPLSTEMALIESDLQSAAFVALLKNMTNPHDQRIEYGRLKGSDNPEAFAATHGGVEKVLAAPELKAAYERRQKIVNEFEALLAREIGPPPPPRASGPTVEISPTATADGSEVLPVVLPPNGGGDWPRWRGPSGQGTSADTGLPHAWDAGSNVAWKTEIPGSGNSSPVVWGQRIYLTTAYDGGKRRALVCLDRGSGKILFEKPTPTTDPQKKIVPKTGYAAATPATDGERLVAFLGNVGVVCFNMEGGVIWRKELPPFEGSHGTGASPIIWRDLVILMQEQNGGPSFGIALDKNSGDERWSFERDSALGWCSANIVSVSGRDQLLYAAKHTVLGIDPTSGDEIWQCAGPTHEVVPTIVSGHGFVYSTSGRSGPTLAIRPDGSGDVTATHVGWRSSRGGPHVPSPVLWKDLLYLMNDTGILSCLDAKSGDRVYQQRLQGRFTASLVAGDDKIYATSESGDTYVIRYGREYELLSSNSIGEGVLASPAIVGGQLFLRGETHLFSIGATETASR